MHTPTSCVAAFASPFNCVWIPSGTVGKIDGFIYAVCTRVPEFPRIVSEEDCLRCPLWQEPPLTSDDRV